MREIQVLDHGYVRLIESWGEGDAEEPEAAIIEAARQSTQGAFRGWGGWHCNTCGRRFEKKPRDGKQHIAGVDSDEKLDPSQHLMCDESKGWSNDEKLLGFLFNNNPPHAGPFEFCGMTIEVQAPILVFREWHRHRTQSYNEMSARYAPLPDTYYMPTEERLFLTQEKNKQAQKISDSPELTTIEAQKYLGMVDEFYKYAERIYQHGLSIGIPKEVARVVMPVGHYSRMRATGNLRNWLQFLALRMHPDAQWEIRQFADAVGEIIMQEFPRTGKLFMDKTGLGEK